MADAPTLAQPTLAEVVAQLRALVPEESPIHNQDPFGVWETYLTLAAQVRVDDVATIAALLPQGFTMTATGQFLDQHGRALSLERIAARRAEHDVHFTVRAGGVVPAGTVVQTELDAAGEALRFVVPIDTDVALPGGLVRVVAEEPGVRHNVGAGRIQTLVTVLPFVSGVSNGTDSLVVAGVNQETDAQYRERQRLRWPALSRGSTWHAYLAWALEVPGIVKVQVLDQHPRGQGTVDVVVAPASGLPTADQVAEVQALVTARRPVGSDALVRSPTPRPIDVALTLYLQPGALQSVQVWTARVQALFDQLAIGETFFPSRLADTLHNFADVRGVVLDVPVQPVVPASGELVLPGTVTVVLT